MATRQFGTILATLLLFSTVLASGADISGLVKQLDSEREADRTTAIAELRKLGENLGPAAHKLEESGNLSPRQQLLLHRITGDILLERNTLKPIDLSTLAPLGFDKAKGLAGIPSLLLNKETKTIAMDCVFAIETGPLEYLAVQHSPNARMHETIVAVDVLPRDISVAMLVCNYTYAGDADEEGRINLPHEAGVMVSVEFLWEPPHANLRANTEIPELAIALRQKNTALASAGPDASARLLMDMESDLAFAKRYLPYPMEQDPKSRRNLLESLHKALEDTRWVCDAARREATLKEFEACVKLDFPGVDLKATEPLPEKKLVRVPIEFFAWNTSTEDVMKRVPFAFSGSRFEKDGNGKRVFMADVEGSIMAIKYDPCAIMNTLLDTRGIDPQHAAGYSINRDLIPRALSKARLIFEPWSGEALTPGQLHDIGEKKSSGTPMGNGLP